MDGERSQLQLNAHHGRAALLRWLLALPLIYGVCVWAPWTVWIVSRNLLGSGWVWYAECEAEVLSVVVPCVLAVALLFSQRRHRALWLVVLVFAIAWSGVLLNDMFSYPSLPVLFDGLPFYLLVVAVVRLLWPERLHEQLSA